MIARTIINTDHWANLVDKFRLSARITDNDFDTLAEMHVKAALDSAERETGCLFLQSQLVITTREQCVTGIYPIISVASVTLNGEDIDYTTYDGRIEFDNPDAGEVVINCVAGYDYPPELVQSAIYLIATRLFTNPMDSVEQLPKASTNLLKQYRRWQR